jgi:hypothetical protein
MFACYAYCRLTRVKETCSENDAIAAVGRTLVDGLAVYKVSKEYKIPPTTLKGRLLISSPAKEMQISTETAIQFDLGKGK